MSLTLGMVICMERVSIYREELRTACFQIGSGGMRVKGKILNESILMKILCVLILISCVATHLTFVPFISDEDTFVCQFKVLYYVCGTYFGTSIIIIALVIQGWILANVILIPAHIILNMRFQFLILNDHVRDLGRSGNFLVMQDRIYQELVHHKLRQCVKHHIEIKR
ncbi:hypothetical protein JTB14_017765 [Gonioctena quinquepunctata]|nr:hypothetical protein JTB14_017765 [Gonioctena quinquepunctata]